MKITNTQKGPRGLNTEDGSILVEPGETVDVKLSKAEHAIAKGTGWFEFGAAPKVEPTDKEIVDGLSQDDKAAYDKMDDAAKAKFIADKKAAA